MQHETARKSIFIIFAIILIAITIKETQHNSNKMPIKATKITSKNSWVETTKSDITKMANKIHTDKPNKDYDTLASWTSVFEKDGTDRTLSNYNKDEMNYDLRFGGLTSKPQNNEFTLFVKNLSAVQCENLKQTFVPQAIGQDCFQNTKTNMFDFAIAFN